MGDDGRPRERRRTGRRRNAADGADQEQQGVVRRVCQEEPDAAMGAAGRDGGADAVPAVGRRELRDRHDHLR